MEVQTGKIKLLYYFTHESIILDIYMLILLLNMAHKYISADVKLEMMTFDMVSDADQRKELHLGAHINVTLTLSA
jgi:hypothetical protein